MEDKSNLKITEWYKQCLEHCESFGISKNVIYLFIHLQDQKHEQNYKEAQNPRIPNKSNY